MHTRRVILVQSHWSGRVANKSTSERQKGTSASLRQGISTEGWRRQNNFSARPYLGSGQKIMGKMRGGQISRNSSLLYTPSISDQIKVPLSKLYSSKVSSPFGAVARAK